MKKNNPNTRIIDLTLGELLDAVEERVKATLAGKPQADDKKKRYVYGLKGLAKLFGCSKTISNLKEITVEPATDDELLQDIGLKWSHKKVALIEIGYAFHLAKCFGDRLTVKDVIMKLAKAFDVEITENYIYKKFNEIKVRTLDSRTYFLDLLTKMLTNHMEEQDGR